jgi:hypothetical protein
MTQVPEADVRSFLRFAAVWHVLWGTLLIPYAVIVVLFVGGQGAAQNLVDELARAFFLVPIFMVAALPINLATAAVTGRLLAGTPWLAHLLLVPAAFGGVWFFATHVVGPPMEVDPRLPLDAYSIWAAGAGAAYGLVLAMGPDPGCFGPTG